MRAVVMAGGMGTRFGDPEKCLRPVGGIPMLLRVVGALLASGAAEVAVATTARHVGTAWLAGVWGLEVAYTPGRGYPEDFRWVAERYAPAVVAACDLADLSPRHVRPLVGLPTLATAVSGGRPVGLSWVPDGGLDRWVEVEVPPLLNVNTWGDWERAEAAAPPAYPLPVDPSTVLDHEETLDGHRPPLDLPAAVEAWTCVVLDGHHRARAAREEGRPLLALPLDYSAVDVNVDRLEVLARAYGGRPFPPKTTWHVYRGRHVSQLPYGEAGGAVLRCSPL